MDEKPDTTQAGFALQPSNEILTELDPLER
jgi:hypothetical protein